MIANAPTWMLAYFGADLVRLSAELVEEGKKYAVVKIVDTDQKAGYSKIGYILIQKSGKYGISPHESLFEGVPDMSDLFRMKSRLEKAESK